MDEKQVWTHLHVSCFIQSLEKLYLSVNTTANVRANETLTAYELQLCRGKTITITYSECVSVALHIQHPMRMRCIMSYEACLPLSYFLHYLIKGTIFGKKLLNIKHVFWFCLQFYMKRVLCYEEGQAVPLQAWSGPEGSRKLRFPDYMTTAQDGGKIVSPTHRPPSPPGNAPGTHFC